MPGRGLDHLVLGVRDLDAAASLCETLGFTVGARNRHPWGTHNRIVQFPGSFLELITVGEPSLIVEHGPRRFSFGAFVRDALARGEGLSMLVLESADATADNAAFRQAGIGDFEPFFFERQGARPDGSTVRVAFTLCFAADPAAPDVAFFLCQQHEPQNFWNPAFQLHLNGASALRAVTMTAEEPAAHAGFLAAFSGVPLEIAGAGLVAHLPRGRIDLVRGERSGAHGAGGSARFTGFTVQVSDLGAMRLRLEKAGIGYASHDGRIVVEALGTRVGFEAD
jgi:catechol 2,3-dioxygenase-like lactoylglutathione lyase family enzyme